MKTFLKLFGLLAFALIANVAFAQPHYIETYSVTGPTVGTKYTNETYTTVSSFVMKGQTCTASNTVSFNATNVSSETLNLFVNGSNLGSFSPSSVKSFNITTSGCYTNFTIKITGGLGLSSDVQFQMTDVDLGDVGSPNFIQTTFNP